MLRYPTPAPRPNSLSPNQVQAFLALESLWISYWPFVSASIIAVFMLLFGLAVAGLEAAGLELGSQIDTTSVSVSSASAQCGKSSNIGVGIWSGAIIAVAAISILIINCASSVKHWAHIAIGLVSSAAVFSATNLSINAKTVRQAVVSGGFSSSESTKNRLAAAQIPAASLSFIACIVFIFMYIIVVGIQIPRAQKRQQKGGFPGQSA